jgi:hypothetical protein
MTTTALALLVAGRDLIADPERWTVGKLARDSSGKARRPDHPEACQWCAMGGIIKNLPGDGPSADKTRETVFRYLDEAAGDVTRERIADKKPVIKGYIPYDWEGPRSVTFLNDGPDGYESALRAYDIAIERARAKEAGP